MTYKEVLIKRASMQKEARRGFWGKVGYGTGKTLRGVGWTSRLPGRFVSWVGRGLQKASPNHIGMRPKPLNALQRMFSNPNKISRQQLAADLANARRNMRLRGDQLFINARKAMKHDPNAVNASRALDPVSRQRVTDFLKNRNTARTGWHADVDKVNTINQWATKYGPARNKANPVRRDINEQQATTKSPNRAKTQTQMVRELIDRANQGDGRALQLLTNLGVVGQNVQTVYDQYRAAQSADTNQ